MSAGRRVIKGMENIWRRFKIIGSSEKEKKLNQLVEDKKLTRDDLTLILNTISLSEKETAQQLGLLNGKLDRIISLLESQQKIQFYVLASQGLDVLKLSGRDLTEMCAEALGQSNRRKPVHRQKL